MRVIYPEIVPKTREIEKASRRSAKQGLICVEIASNTPHPADIPTTCMRVIYGETVPLSRSRNAFDSRNATGRGVIYRKIVPHRNDETRQDRRNRNG